MNFFIKLLQFIFSTIMCGTGIYIGIKGFYAPNSSAADIYFSCCGVIVFLAFYLVNINFRD